MIWFNVAKCNMLYILHCCTGAVIEPRSWKPDCLPVLLMLIRGTQICCTPEWDGTNVYSVPGQETVGIQDAVGTQCMVLSNDMQFTFASGLLDQFANYGADVRRHHRRLRDRHQTAKSAIKAQCSLKFKMCKFWHFIPPHLQLKPYNSNSFNIV